MARYRREFERRERSFNLSWFPWSVKLSSTVIGAGKLLLLNRSAERDYDQVCQRQFVSILEKWSGGAGVIASIVLPTAFAKSVTPGGELPSEFPDPTDQDGTDDWSLWQGVGDSIVGSTGMMLDSKAKRRINKDQILYTVMKVISDGGSAGFDPTIVGRCLMKWE